MLLRGKRVALDGRVLAGCKSAGMLTVVHQENGFDHVYFWAIKQHYTIKVMILMSLYIRGTYEHLRAPEYTLLVLNMASLPSKLTHYPN